MLDIAELVGDKASPADGEAAIGEDLIAAVIVGMSENPIIDVRMGLDEVFHVNQESIVQTAAGISIVGRVEGGAVMGDDHLMLSR